jgi:hypothetical protein
MILTKDKIVEFDKNRLNNSFKGFIRTDDGFKIEITQPYYLNVESWYSLLTFDEKIDYHSDVIYGKRFKADNDSPYICTCLGGIAIVSSNNNRRSRVILFRDNEKIYFIVLKPEVIFHKDYQPEFKEYVPF